MKFFFVFLITSLIISSKGKQGAQKNNAGPINYKLVSTWPEQVKDFNIGQPTGIGVDTNDNLFVFHRAGRIWTEPFPDSLIAQNTIIELDHVTGKIINAWGANYFIMPHGLTVDKDNNIWVTDVGLHQIFKFSHDGTLLMKMGEPKVPGNDSVHFNLPTDIAVARDGSFYVSDGYGNSRIIQFSSTGKYIREWGAFGKKQGEFNIPHGITIDHNHMIYVADRQNNRVQVFDSSGHFIKELNNDVLVDQLPSMAIDNAGRLFAIDYDPSKNKDSSVKGSTVFQFDSSHALNHFGASGSTHRSPSWFHDIAIDSKGNIYVGDIMALRVLKFQPGNPF